MAQYRHTPLPRTRCSGGSYNTYGWRRTINLGTVLLLFLLLLLLLLPPQQLLLLFGRAVDAWTIAGTNGLAIPEPVDRDGLESARHSRTCGIVRDFVLRNGCHV
jgi:hypothetical protein